MKKTNSIKMYKKMKLMLRRNPKHETKEQNLDKYPKPYRLCHSSYLPSAPPIEDMSVFSRTWAISGELEIQTKKGITGDDELKEILGLIMDEYEGPMLKRPLVISLFLMLGAHLQSLPKSKHSNFICRKDINKRITFALKGPEFSDSYDTMSWTRTKGQGDTWFRIVFKLSFQNTKRPGEQFDTLYSPENFKDSPMELHKLLDEFGVKHELAEDGTTIFII